MKHHTAAQQTDAVRAYLVGLRLDGNCLKEWHPYLELLEAKGRLPRRAFFRYALWVCAKEEDQARKSASADDSYRHHMFGLHKFLREAGFLSEFGRARRSWFHVENMLGKIDRRRYAKRRFHKGRTYIADLRVGLMHGREAMSRGYGRDGESLQDFAREFISDWRNGFCGGPTIYKLPDRKDGNHLRWPYERQMDLDSAARATARRERRYSHG